MLYSSDKSVSEISSDGGDDYGAEDFVDDDIPEETPLTTRPNDQKHFDRDDVVTLWRLFKEKDGREVDEKENEIHVSHSQNIHVWFPRRHLETQWRDNELYPRLQRTLFIFLRPETDSFFCVFSASQLRFLPN